MSKLYIHFSTVFTIYLNQPICFCAGQQPLITLMFTTPTAYGLAGQTQWHRVLLIRDDKHLRLYLINKDMRINWVWPVGLLDCSKQLLTSLASISTLLFNTSFHQGELPLDCKQASIAHIFKKGNKAHATISFLLLAISVKSQSV